MKKAVFITYNSVGKDRTNGSYATGDGVRRSTVLQGFIRKDKSGPDLNEKRQTMIRLWRSMSAKTDLLSVDLFVVYCGKIPATSILLAATLPVEKVLFVHCGCGDLNIPFLDDLGMDNVPWIVSECGGIDTMQKIYSEFMNTGRIQTEMTLVQGIAAAREKSILTALE